MVCAYKYNWIMRVSALLKFICTHHCSYENTSFEKEKSFACIYIFKTFPTMHF